MILIIGASGRIGAEVLSQLREKSVPVRVIVKNEADRSAFGPDVEVVVGDLHRPESLTEAFRGVRKVFIVTPGTHEQVDIQVNSIQAAKRAGVAHFVKISDLGAAADSTLAHARWNWQIEQELVQSGMAYTVLRPRFFMQNFLLVVAPSVISEGTFYAPAGEGRIPFVDIRDIAAVAVAALTEEGHENKIYEVTGPEALSFNDIAQRLSSALGRTVRFVDVSSEAAHGAFVKMGLPRWFATDLVALFDVVRAGDAAEITAIVPQITRRPARSLDHFLAENLAAFSS